MKLLTILLRKFRNQLAQVWPTRFDLQIRNISDDHELCRWLVYPRMFEENALIYMDVFEFQTKQNFSDSVVWSDGIIRRACTDWLGKRDARKKRKAKQRPDISYRGYLSATAQEIRRLESKNGLSFEVGHAPAEGFWHAHIAFHPGQVQTTEKSDRIDLRRQIFELMKRNYVRS